jgi:hypothetical protein
MKIRLVEEYDYSKDITSWWTERYERGYDLFSKRRWVKHDCLSAAQSSDPDHYERALNESRNKWARLKSAKGQQRTVTVLDEFDPEG